MLQALSELLLLTAKGEKQVEVVRQLLCEQEEFVPYTTFRTIDNGRKGYLDENDVQKFLGENGFCGRNLDECVLFIQQYDQRAARNLVYTEFLRAVLPLDNAELRKQCSMKEPSLKIQSKNGSLPSQVAYTLARLFDWEIKTQLDLEEQRQKIARRNDFALPALFQLIDVEKKGHFGLKEMKVFVCQKCGLDTYEEELVALLKRIDYNADGAVCYADFKRAVSVFTNKKCLIERKNSVQEQLTESKITENFQKINSEEKKIVAQSCVSHARSQSLSTTHCSEGSVNKNQQPTGSDNKKKISASNKENQDLPLVRRQYLSRDYNPSYCRSDQKRVQTQNQQDESASQRGSEPPSAKKSTEGDQWLLRDQDSRLQTSESQRMSTNSSNNNKAVLQVVNGLENREQQQLVKAAAQTHKPVIREYKTYHYKRRSSVSGQGSHKQRVLEIFTTVIENEKRLERAKQNLALRPDFNVLDAFRIIDRADSGFVTAASIQEYLQAQKQSINQVQVQLFVSRYDVDRDHSLRFSEFAEAFMPKQVEYRNLVNRRSNGNVESTADLLQNIFTSETIKMMISVFAIHFQNENEQFELQRQQFVQLSGISFQDAFKLIDHNQDGQACFADIQQFFERQDQVATESEVNHFIDRFVKQGEKYITFKDFITELTPKTL